MIDGNSIGNERVLRATFCELAATLLLPSTTIIMAARKSCTTLTWAEAKAKVGGDPGAKKKAAAPGKQKMNLTEKAIAKNLDVSDDLSKAQARRAQRSNEKALAAIAAEKERKLQERLNATVQPSQQAAERLRELATLLQSSNPATTATSATQAYEEDDYLEKIVECKEMQLDEILALEAIYEDVFRMAERSQYSELVEKRDNNLKDDSKDSQRAFASHPEISFSLELEIEDNRGETTTKELEDLVAHILLQVTLPPLYPLHGAIPIFQIVDVMVTDRSMSCSPDKPLETLGYLNEKRLLEEINQQATELLPDPCVIAAVTHLTETAFDTLEVAAHVLV